MVWPTGPDITIKEDEIMRNPTDQEIRAMVGTEFIYIFSDHAEIPAIVAAFDPEIGFTCLATDTIDSVGDDLSHLSDENGNICLIGQNSEDIKGPTGRSRVSFTLSSIKHLGYYKEESYKGFGYSCGGYGTAVCSF